MTEPTIESIHRDIDFGNRFRLELDKTLLTLVTALFAFTIAFAPTLTSIANAIFLQVGWIALALSMAGGLFELHGWECYYLTYRDYDFHANKAGGEAERAWITTWRRTARLVFFAGFLVGAAAIGLFAVENLPNVRPGK